MKLLVTGANGQLGSEFKTLTAKGSHHTMYFLTRAELDLSAPESIVEVLSKYDFDILINCAAYTAVDKAESEIDLANTINVESVGAMAQYCNQHNKILIQISTDFIFSGKGYLPILETDQEDPLSIYGSSKLAGEKAIMSTMESFYIVRTSWVYSSYGNNFLKTMLRYMDERSELGIVMDQVGTPTYARDLAQAILNMIAHPSFKSAYGVYNYSNLGTASWYDFACRIKDIANKTVSIKPIRTEAYPTPAARPSYSVLDKSKIQDVFGLEIPYWTNSLQSCIELL